MELVAFKLVVYVLLLAFALPWLVNTARFHWRCRQVRRELDLADHVLSAHRVNQDIQQRHGHARLHGLSAAQSRMDGYDDAA